MEEGKYKAFFWLNARRAVTRALFISLCSTTLTAGRRRMISSEDLESIRACYDIPERIELLASERGMTLKDYHLRCICLNEFMCKAGVNVPFELGVAELLNTFDVAPIDVAPNS
ncbi:hypothetical protein ACLOJK_036462 [Asimina triloba]